MDNNWFNHIDTMVSNSNVNNKSTIIFHTAGDIKEEKPIPRTFLM